MISGIGEFTEGLRQQPEISPEYCVHAIIETARCRSCVDACPKAAWVLDDASLGLDQAACDGCGLCVPACPQGAIRLSRTPHFTPSICEGQTSVFLACADAGVTANAEIMPCVHSQGLIDLLHLLRLGVRRLIVASGACERCFRGRVMRLQQRLAALNHALTRSGHPGLRMDLYPASQWQRLLESSSPVREGPSLSRRNFLRRLTSDGLQLSGLAEPFPIPVQPAGLLFPCPGPEAIWPHVPQLDTQRCDGCDACARLCPQQAIRLTAEPPAYELEARRCSGCGICVDVCTQRAISLTSWQVQDQPIVPLRQQRCRACGAVYHLPTAAPQTVEAYCQVCRRHNHPRQLYQVLE